jgi:hypothetical protein
MPIIIKPENVQKNTDNIFLLNKSDLLLNSQVAASPYFSNPIRWSRVELNYISSISNQSVQVYFTASQIVPEGIFRVSIFADDIFLIDSIIIFDFDNGSLRVDRRTLETSDFDVSFSVGPVTWTSDVSSSFYVGTATSIEKISGGLGWNLNVVSNQVLSNNMSIEARVNKDLPRNMTIGFQNTSANSSSPTNVLRAINYGLYCDGERLYFIYKRVLDYGLLQIAGDLTFNDNIKLTIEGGATGTLRAYKNDVQLYSVSVPLIDGVAFANPYRVGVTLYEVGTKFDEIVFSTV